ncbi:hypothetical protein PsorP6_008912 [Peronosclerospora sorghi]|uniref:Uncharacterized protein n=1 Tax=Peronosclerospora sorghi TaxID=230839 RepID=A0ACC0W097_9STRA|nr:hypothetical protein PsorP6_008912 [Peronosclerospora sorghi]
MDGFSLNISTSSGVGKRSKRKNSFRAKQQAKRAKVKARKLTKVALEAQADHSDWQIKKNNKHQRQVSRDGNQELRAVTQTLQVEIERADVQEEKEALESTKSIRDKEEEEWREKSGHREKESVAAEGQTIAAGEMQNEVKSKPFGSRRNPNKEKYKVETFTQPRVNLDSVLSKPLMSSSSEKIFATHTFESMNLTEKLVNVLNKDAESGGFGFMRPTNVQVQTIPSVLEGNDVLVKSETGSGKTLSYLLPIVQKLQERTPRIQRQDGCLALVLAPTRELSTQILETATKLIQPFVYLVPGAITGGEKKKTEKARLRKGIVILVATPGRLADHLVNTQSFNYSHLQFLVLDEADRLLDMGFEKQITQILSILDSKKSISKRQNILVSATINSGVQQLAKMSLSDPVLIDADASTSGQVAASEIKDTSQEKYFTPHQLMQHFMFVPAKARLCALTCFLREELCHASSELKNGTGREKCKIVVFFSTCDAVDFHYALFQKCAWPSGRGPKKEINRSEENHGVYSLFGTQGPVFRLHGNIPQQDRVLTFKSFCCSSSGVLLCTDVAARGLNLPTVKWIVQYDPPSETRDYVHRVGRTARSGNQGSSLLFLMPSESDYLDYLSKRGLELNAVSLEKTVARVGKHSGFLTTARNKLLHEVVQRELQFLYEETLLADKELFELACQAFHSFVRSYATHSSDTRHIFHVRSLHFGHVAKSFGLREPPASSKLRTAGRNAKMGTLQKRKERDDKQVAVMAKKQSIARNEKRRYAQNVSEFAS